MIRTPRTLFLGLAAGQLWSCSTVLGLDRFDEASLLVGIEAGGPLSTADGASAGSARNAGFGDASEGSAGASPDGGGLGADGESTIVDSGVQLTADVVDGADATSADVADTSPDANGVDESETGAIDDSPLEGSEESGAAPDAAAPLYSYTFDTSMQGWSIFWTGLGDAGSQDTTLALSTTMGDPSPGSLELQAPFNGPNESINMGIEYSGAGANLAGRTVTMRVKLASGLSSDPNNPGGALLYAQDSNYIWSDNGVVSMLPSGDGTGGWITISMNLDHPNGAMGSGYSDSSIHLLGVQFGTYSGVAPSSVSSADIFIDTVVVQ